MMLPDRLSAALSSERAKCSTHFSTTCVFSGGNMISTPGNDAVSQRFFYPDSVVASNEDDLDDEMPELHGLEDWLHPPEAFEDFLLDVPTIDLGEQIAVLPSQFTEFA